MAFTVVWEDEGVVVNMSGVLDIDEIDSAGKALYSDERFRRCKYQLIDLLATDISSLSLEDIGNIATKDVLASITIHNPTAVLVANTHIHSVLIEHYVSLSKQLGIKWDVKMFDTREEAEAWCKEISENA